MPSIRHRCRKTLTIPAPLVGNPFGRAFVALYPHRHAPSLCRINTQAAHSPGLISVAAASHPHVEVAQKRDVLEPPRRSLSLEERECHRPSPSRGSERSSPAAQWHPLSVNAELPSQDRGGTGERPGVCGSCLTKWSRRGPRRRSV